MLLGKVDKPTDRVRFFVQNIIYYVLVELNTMLYTLLTIVLHTLRFGLFRLTEVLSGS